MNSQIETIYKFALIIFVIISILRVFAFSNFEAFYFRDAISHFGQNIFFTTLVISIYIKWLWKFNPLEKTPRLKTKYKGSLISNYDGIARDIKLNISQTLFSIEIIMYTAESRSESKCAVFTMYDSNKKLIYTYVNTPQSSIRDRSPMHYGTAIFDVNNPEEISGEYFTDRNTRGDMNLVEDKE